MNFIYPEAANILGISVYLSVKYSLFTRAENDTFCPGVKY